MERVKQRFEELAEAAKLVAASTRVETIRGESHHSHVSRAFVVASDRHIQHIDSDAWIQWQTSVLSLLERVFGTSSTTFKEFDGATQASARGNVHGKFTKQHAIFMSAKSDFDAGYLFSVENLVHANVFANELEQAEYFLREGYKTPAAVIAGSVLEATLRRLCERHDNITMKERATLSWYNDELKRVGVYNQIVHKQVLSWSAIRNAAAHGHCDEFEPGQVRSMIEGIHDFVAKVMN